MNLLLINSIGRQKWGGGEKWMVLAASELIKKGHHVHIGCRVNSVLEQRAKEANVPVVRIDIYTDFSLAGFLQLKKLVKKLGVELIIGCQNKDVRVAGFMSRLTNGPIVLSRQGVQLLNKSGKYKWSFLPYCDGIITNTNSIKQEYDSYGWWDNEFVKVIYNGINETKISDTCYDLSKYIPASVKNPLVIVSTGRLAKQKGFEYLIDAARSIVKNHPNIYFFIAGTGKLETVLKRQIHELHLDENVHLLGFQKNISELLNAADLFVLPSLYEGMPNSLMEALAHGLPAVSTRVNGVEELMKDGEHGYVVEPKSVSDLEEAIEKLIVDAELKEKGQQGAKHVKEKFSINKMVDSLEKHLLQQISK
ncbi:glycosyltransferase family 4 protein [Carboxylicivirga sp. A043]|uniref:glycosyltransferase family 4 protein n=1 Tax=Carboxylicivirga litoralis TaxID=2816963 RepID=UPI0021CAF56D|nr:glycosyltransferase family 4 protein [Carboxylicivirga sp. A043]MCU4156459.1 glycosyltransferase family 4 protein [Carboxylicivirga sp. A043]